jgi:hypothetical protein
MGVSTPSSAGEFRQRSRVPACGAPSAAHDPQFTLKHFLLLAAVAAVLIGVFSLSTASRSDLGFEAGSHLRSLARAHRLAESDGAAIHIEHFEVRQVTVSAEPVLLCRLLPDLDGVRKPVAALTGSRTSRAPPAAAA